MIRRAPKKKPSDRSVELAVNFLQ